MEDIQMQDNQEVEVENLNGGKSTEEITKPFNPNEIDVDISTVNLGSLIDQLENDEIDLQPDFQRATLLSENKRVNLPPTIRNIENINQYHTIKLDSYGL
jgi:hypothetical protein